ncbi:MAG: polysaccharide export protein EpsE [Burkholderiaceae bacterium]|nr:polysaccharide export protein EpsE [Burkholderiaceae bacterium]
MYRFRIVSVGATAIAAASCTPRAPAARALTASALATLVLLASPAPAVAQARGAAAAAPATQPLPTRSAQQLALQADNQHGDYPLGAGDVIRIQVFQSPDLTVEARVSEGGVISFPLLGAVRVGGLSPMQAERLIATRLRDGGFLQNPQVTLNVVQFRSQQVSVLGSVNRPGRYPLETTGMRLSEVLALAGGIATGGADTAIVMTQREGRPIRMEIDVAEMFLANQPANDIVLQAGDTIYVHRAPQFYVYGQVQRPGNYQLERGMTVAQALAKGGGLTLRGTEKGLRLQRRDAQGVVQTIEPRLDDLVVPDDLLFVRESLF